MTSRRHERFTLTIAAAIMACLSLLVGAAHAQEGHGMHGVGHDTNHNWYQTLKQPGTNVSCCNNTDCRPTMSRVVDGAVQVVLDGDWTPVPSEKILKTPAPDLGDHVCAPKRNNFLPKGYVYCVVLGSGA